MVDERWALGFECDQHRCRILAGLRVQIGQSLVVGREGDIPLGVDLPDRGVSRRAAVVTAIDRGWEVEVSNRNGAVLHPWAQAPVLAGAQNTLTWPRIGIRFLAGAESGVEQSVQHWLLLEADTLPVTPAGARTGDGTITTTHKGKRPIPLSTAQTEALLLVFAAQLQWPPAQPAIPRQLKQVARLLGIGIGAVQQRLAPAHDRALRLGLHRPVHLTDPEYLYLLVRAGYVAPPLTRPHRRELR